MAHLATYSTMWWAKQIYHWPWAEKPGCSHSSGFLELWLSPPWNNRIFTLKPLSHDPSGRGAFEYSDTCVLCEYCFAFLCWPKQSNKMIGWMTTSSNNWKLHLVCISKSYMHVHMCGKISLDTEVKMPSSLEWIVCFTFQVGCQEFCVSSQCTLYHCCRS